MDALVIAVAFAAEAATGDMDDLAMAADEDEILALAGLGFAGFAVFAVVFWAAGGFLLLLELP